MKEAPPVVPDRSPLVLTGVTVPGLLVCPVGLGTPSTSQCRHTAKGLSK